MSISFIKPSLLPDLKPIQPVIPSQKPGASEGATGGGSFAQALGDALKEVDGLHKEADKQINGLALKADGVTPHDAMIAIEKADMAFQMMNQIRSKIIRAYEEVMRTQV